MNLWGAALRRPASVLPAFARAGTLPAIIGAAIRLGAIPAPVTLLVMAVAAFMPLLLPRRLGRSGLRSLRPTFGSR